MRITVFLHPAGQDVGALPARLGLFHHDLALCKCIYELATQAHYHKIIYY